MYTEANNVQKSTEKWDTRPYTHRGQSCTNRRQKERQFERQQRYDGMQNTSERGVGLSGCPAQVKRLKENVSSLERKLPKKRPENNLDDVENRHREIRRALQRQRITRRFSKSACSTSRARRLEMFLPGHVARTCTPSATPHTVRVTIQKYPASFFLSESAGPAPCSASLQVSAYGPVRITYTWLAFGAWQATTTRRSLQSNYHSPTARASVPGAVVAPAVPEHAQEAVVYDGVQQNPS